MARIARLTTPGALHHVISRFVDRDWLVSSDHERAFYLGLLGRALQTSDWRCLAYCLMSNHIHLAMVAGRQELQSWAKKVNSPFAIWLNDQRGRLGPVYADRPSTYRVPGGREPELLAYIHNNPVRARVVATARDSTWSSHRAYLGLEARPPWLHVGEGLQRAACPADPDRFDGFVNGLRDARPAFPDLGVARSAARRHGPFEIATPTLSDSVEVPIVSRTFAPQRPPVTAIVEAVASQLGVSAIAMSRPHARGDVASGKRIVVHAAVALGIAISDAATAVNVSRQRGSAVAKQALSRDERAVANEIVALLGGRRAQS
jgi:hypothetical protein